MEIQLDISSRHWAKLFETLGKWWLETDGEGFESWFFFYFFMVKVILKKYFEKLFQMIF